MNAQHTQGLMVVNPIQLDQIATADASKEIARVTHFGHSTETVIANACRLAACWNACEGVSTEALQLVGRDLLDGEVKPLSDKLADVLAQRDELLEALKDCLRRIADDEEYGFDHAVTKARAAIAKATP